MHRSATASPTPAQARSPTEVVGPVFSIVCLFLLWFVLCRHLSDEWAVNEQYSYGWFVPMFAAFLFWLRWEDRPQPRSAAEAPSSKLQAPNKRQTSKLKPQTLAAAAGSTALLLLLPLRVFEIANPDWRPLSWLHAVVVVTVTLIYIWYLGGVPWVRHFAFPVLFILIAVPWVTPIEEPIVQGLMRVVAGAAAETVSLFGLPAQLQGNLIRLPHGLVGVNEACSGVRSLQTSLMIGLLFGELKRLKLGQRLGLIAGAISIALLGNFVRAVFLVWVAADEGVAATERWHDLAGYSILALVFVGTMLLAALLGRREVERLNAKLQNENQSLANRQSVLRASSFGFRHSAAAIAIFVWLLCVEVAAAGWYRVHEQNMVRHAAWTVRWPEAAPGFRELDISEGVRGTLRFDNGREVMWKEHDGSGINPPSSIYLYFFRWNPGSSSVLRARAHRPDVCLPNVGWKRVADLGLKNYPAQNRLALTARHISFRHETSNAIAHTFFCLQEDKSHSGENVPGRPVIGVAQSEWSAGARLRTVKQGLRNLGQQVLEVAIITAAPMSDQAAEEKFGRIVREVVIAQ